MGGIEGVSEEVYHQKVGGRLREDRREKYLNREPTPSIREMILKIRERTGIRRTSHIGYLAGFSEAVISLAAGGRAGDRPMAHRPVSSTELIYRRLNFIIRHERLMMPLIKYLLLPAFKIFDTVTHK